MTLRTLVEGFPYDWQIEIVRRSGLLPVYWVANDLGNESLLPDGVIYHRSEDAVRGIPAPEFRESAPVPMPDEYFQANVPLLDTVLRMLSIREDQFGEAFPTYAHRRRHVYDLVAYWSFVLNHLSIEAVLIEAIPHLPHHYVIYHLAKEKGLVTLFFNGVGEPSRFFICESLDDVAHVRSGAGPVGETEELVPSRTPPKYAEHRPERRVTLNRLRARSRLSLAFVGEVLGYTRARFRLGVERWWQRRARGRFMREYARYARADVPDSAFVYYPLSEQPEDTSFPLGGNFEDQVYAARYLAGLLPDGVKLIIKEHPNQRPWRGRYDGYYRELASIPGVELIAMGVSTFDLIEKCDAVATISGQAGWEGLTNRKPVIAFGAPWYATCPYVYPIESLREEPGRIWRDRPLDAERIKDWYGDFLASTYAGYPNAIAKPSGTTSVE